MKSEEFFEMLNGIDDNFVDAALPNAERTQVIQPQEIRMTKRRLPWGIAAAAACLAVCAAVGAVIAVNTGKGNMIESNSPLQPGLKIPETVEIYPGYTDSELPLTFTIEELGVLPRFRIRDDKTIMRLSAVDMNIDGWEVFSDKLYVRSVYLCDLNFDGYREIAAAVTDENGEKFVRVADVRNQKEYEYKVEGYESRWTYDSLVLKDKKLYLCTSDGSKVSKETLSLDDLELVIDKVLEPVVTGSVTTILDENTKINGVAEFTMDEFPDSKFYIDSRSLSVKRTDRELVEMTNGDIKSVHLWDEDGDGKREIFVTFNGVRSYVRAFSAERNGWNGWSYGLSFMGHNHVFVAREDGVHVIRNDDEDNGLATRDNMFKIDDEPDSPIERIIDYDHYDNQFTMPEFPNLDFTVDEDGNVKMFNKISDIEEGHIVITNTGKLWLADLNDDGYREIISEGWGKNSKTYIQVYDIASGKHYSYTDAYNVHLSPSYDKVAVIYLNDSGNGVSGRHWEYLTFDILKETAVGSENNQDNPADAPGESTEPEPLSSVFENDKLRLQVDLEKSAYKKGDIITVDAKVTNKSDKKFYIFVPTATADTHTEIRTYISLDGRRLNDIDAVRYWDDAIKLIPLEPGESFTLKKVRFDTTYTGDESLGISKQPVQSGLYQGTTEITILDSPGFETPAESYYTSFAISIM